MRQITIEELKAMVEERTFQSAWGKGVKEYALELLDNIYNPEDQLSNVKVLEKALLNGASDWKQYSWAGCAYIYDRQIASRLCNPSELKKTSNGAKKPNASEEWLDVQARALSQACHIIVNAFEDFEDISYHLDNLVCGEASPELTCRVIKQLGKEMSILDRVKKALIKVVDVQ